MSQKRAIIIGAGPTGLTAGYELLRRSKIKLVILEKNRTFFKNVFRGKKIMNTICKNDFEVISKTKSVCPACLRTLRSFIINKNGRVLLSKKCPEHGNFEILLSNDFSYYTALKDYFLKTMPSKLKQTRYLLYLTAKCNLNCPICALGVDAKDNLDISLEDIKDLLETKKVKNLILFGAEPTCRDDLAEIIRLLKTKQKIVYLYTNGMRFLDEVYLKEIVSSGIDKIYFQFDGFDDRIYELFRGQKLKDKKLAVLEKLKTANASVVINATIARGINEEQMKKIFEYALANNFIKCVNYMTYEKAGLGKHLFPEGFIMPDELVDIFVEQNKTKVTRRGIFLTQKLLYAYLSFFNRHTCFYIQYFWIIRNKDSFYALNEVLNLELAEKSLDQYKILYKKNRIWAKIYLLMNIYKLFLSSKIVIVFKELVKTVFAFALGTDEYTKKTNRLLQIVFSTGCDSDKIDYQIVRNCQNGFIYKNLAGKIKTIDSDGFFVVHRDKLTALDS
ncbi:MAG: radical SAM protein [Candidatus Omnitrophota bacterium]